MWVRAETSGQGWNYDAYYQYGTSIFTEEYMNDVSVSRLQNALEVSPVTGQCASGASGCVPANLFQLGQLSKAAIAYTSVPGFQEGQNIEQVVSASLTGDLGQYGAKSPLATDGVGVALGGEYRRENLSLTTDEEFSTPETFPVRAVLQARQRRHLRCVRAVRLKSAFRWFRTSRS